MGHDLEDAFELEVLVVLLLLLGHGASYVALHSLALIVQKLVNIASTREKEEENAVHQVAEKHFFVVFAVLVLHFPNSFKAASSAWLVSSELLHRTFDEVIARCLPLLLGARHSVAIYVHDELVDKNLPLVVGGDVIQPRSKMTVAESGEHVVDVFLRLIGSQNVVNALLFLELDVAIDVVL